MTGMLRAATWTRKERALGSFRN